METSSNKLEQTRDRSIDVMKGILVIQMVLCHCIQFFGNDSWPIQKQVCDYINLTTFPGFLFAFGFACNYAYFSKSFIKAVPRMIKTAVKMLLAFYISSICYIAFVEYDYYDPRVPLQVVRLEKYAGWSEFLASFFAIMLIGAALFVAFQRINVWILAGIGVIGFALTYLPYSRITNPWVALIVGSRHYITFPILQYLFYFAAGVWLCKNGMKRWKWMLAVAFLLSVPEFVHYLGTDGLSDRFPPDGAFVFGASVIVFLYYVLSRKLSGMNVRILSVIGEDSIFYLLFTNIIIFAFAGSRFRQGGIQFAIVFYLLLMLTAWFCQHTVSRKRYESHMNGV